MSDFAVPFYAWPTTAACIAVTGAIFTAFCAIKAQRRLKTVDAISSCLTEIQKFVNLISSVSVSSVNLDKQRLKEVGGWDAACDQMNLVKCHLRNLRLYMPDQTPLCNKIQRLIESLYHDSFKSSAMVMSPSSEIDTKRNASIYLVNGAGQIFKELDSLTTLLLERV